jgi:NAD(P)-dependent dehydrogenase (short-subunit alcohol dehydrogenase family)
MFQDAIGTTRRPRELAAVPVAIVTGASKGLGRAVVRALAADGWSVVVDARAADELTEAAEGLDPATTRALPGDVTEPAHREDLVAAAWEFGGLDLLVNNASLLGPSPRPRLADYATADLARVYEVDVLGPHALLREALPLLRRLGGTVLNVSSDAAVEAYAGWGGYGSAKAALDHLSAVLAVEEPGLSVYAFDPGDMRTAMQQAAFPGEDISDRPTPGEVAVPALLALLRDRPPSGRYRAADLLTPKGAADRAADDPADLLTAADGAAR